MKNVKKIRKGDDKLERTKSQFWFLLRYISEDVRPCRISCYMYMRSDKTGKDPRRVWRM